MRERIERALAAFEMKADASVLARCRSTIDELRGRLTEEASEVASRPVSIADLVAMVDHTNLKPTATRSDIEKLVSEAIEHRFASVCVNPTWVPMAKRLLSEASSQVRVCTVVGFPLGAELPSGKREQTKAAVAEGADEVDMVINIAAIKDCDYGHFITDAEAVLQASGKALTKAIIEACYLEDEEKVVACIILKSLGYDFVKTSTGFGTGGATRSDVSLMRAVVGPDTGVKAAGGIRSFEQALGMVVAGANRIGTSAGTLIAAGPAVSC